MSLRPKSGRVTGYPEIKVRCGLVPRNAHVFTVTAPLGRKVPLGQAEAKRLVTASAIYTLCIEDGRAPKLVDLHGEMHERFG